MCVQYAYQLGHMYIANAVHLCPSLPEGYVCLFVWIFSCYHLITAGIILVHDLTNRKSHNNLSTWLTEFYQSSCREGGEHNSLF